MADLDLDVRRPRLDASEAEVSWVIDPVDACLLSASDEGLEVWGLDSTARLPMALDCSMPALSTLRLAPLGLGGSRGETLLLWTSRGPLHCHCSVSPCDVTPGRRALVLRVLQLAAQSGVARTSVPERGQSNGALPRWSGAQQSPSTASEHRQSRGAALSQAVPRADDLATLQEIARRIREGRGAASLAEAATEPPRWLPAPTEIASEAPALAAGDAQSELLVRASHEIRTPLAAIAVLAEVIRDELYGPVGVARYRSYAKDIAQSARHALAVVDATLGRTTQSEPEPELVITAVDVNQAVEECLATASPLSAQARLQLSSVLASRLPWIVADRRALKQILLNLLSNAIKFTPADGRVTVRTSCSVAGPLVIEVSDTGPGMSRMETERATVGVAMVRSGDGSGLGLQIAQRQAHLIGATLAVASISGRGTTVTVTFPRDRLIPA